MVTISPEWICLVIGRLLNALSVKNLDSRRPMRDRRAADGKVRTDTIRTSANRMKLGKEPCRVVDLGKVQSMTLTSNFRAQQVLFRWKNAQTNHSFFFTSLPINQFPSNVPLKEFDNIVI